MSTATIPGFVYTQFTDQNRALTLASTTDTNKLINTLAININDKPASSFTYKWDPANSMPGYARVIFSISVGRSLFDKFFNSPAGIRAQFFDGASQGAAFQSNLTTKILDTLANYLANHDTLHEKQGIKSIVGSYSKFWMDESQGLPSGPYDQSFPIKQWVDSANPQLNKAILTELKITQALATDLSEWGIWAPIRFNIKFLGTFVDANGKEWVAPLKETRGGQIKYLGFS